MDEDHKSLFTLLDYTLFFGLIIVSALTGVYFGFFGKKQDSPKEYLHGGKTMSILPITASLIASNISSITLLAIPTDVYLNGTVNSMALIAIVLMTIMIIFVYLPVFYKLQVSSSFEYLHKRFSKRVCVMASFIFAFVSTMFLPVQIYIPGLAFNQVSGLHINIVLPIVGIICIFYTATGGIKAVVWTDTLQMVAMTGSILVVLIYGIVTEGGFSNIWNKSVEGGRINFNWNADPLDKRAYVSSFIGFTVLLCGVGSEPVFTQRFLALPTLKKAKITAVLYCIGILFFKIVTLCLGLIIYSHYKDCSPLTAGYIEKPDQILPFYVVDVAGALSGLPGIFTAGLFSAALSSISSGLNTMAGTIYEDLIKPFMPENTTDKRASDIMKLIVLCLGIIYMILVFAVQHLGTILQICFMLDGIALGSTFAMYSLGMLVPQINEKGVFYGSIVGILTVGWIISGSIYYQLKGQIKEDFLDFSIETCDVIKNTSYSMKPIKFEDQEPPMYLYRISYYYYCVIGFIVSTIAAIIVSLFTGGLNQTVHKDLLCPLIHPFLKGESTKSANDEPDTNELQQLKRNLPAPTSITS